MVYIVNIIHMINLQDKSASIHISIVEHICVGDYANVIYSDDDARNLV